MTIKRLIPSTLLVLAALSSAVVAAELPNYEVKALPATPHQLSVVGASAAEEQAPAADLTRAGMPATNHQLAVLTTHRRSSALVVPTTVGSARN